MTISKDFGNSTLTFFEADAPLIFSLMECSDLIRDHLALHGAIQMAAASANQSDDCESAFIYAEDTIAYIYEQYPDGKSLKTPRGEIIQAIARIKGYSIQETTGKWNQLSQEERTKLATNDRVRGMITVIKGERAQRYLDHPYAQANSTRRKFYEHDFDLENRKASMRFANDRQLGIDLALVKDVNAIALYGAEQKISDSYSGVKGNPEKRAKAERIIRNLYAGDWISKKEATGKEADRSLLDTQVVHQLVDWMRWPPHATMNAVSLIDEQDKPKLISETARKHLIICSRELGIDNNPGRCDQRDIANLLGEVIDRLTPMDD